MLFGCIVTKLKSFFDSLVWEYATKLSECGTFSRCRCNIFTIGNRSTSSPVYFGSSSIRKSFTFSPLKPVHAEYVACLWLIRCSCLKSSSIASVREHVCEYEYTRSGLQS